MSTHFFHSFFHSSKTVFLELITLPGDTKYEWQQFSFSFLRPSLFICLNLRICPLEVFYSQMSDYQHKEQASWDCVKAFFPKNMTQPYCHLLPGKPHLALCIITALVSYYQPYRRTGPWSCLSPLHCFKWEMCCLATTTHLKMGHCFPHIVSSQQGRFCV